MNLYMCMKDLEDKTRCGGTRVRFVFAVSREQNIKTKEEDRGGALLSPLVNHIHLFLKYNTKMQHLFSRHGVSIIGMHVLHDPHKLFLLSSVSERRRPSCLLAALQ